MQLSSHLFFPPFRLDLTAQQLWHGDELIPLRRKPFAVLRYLAEHPERLVTQDELRQAVWPDIHVSEAILRVHIREIRAALEDNADAPRLIATIPRRGYRFLAPVERAIGVPDHNLEQSAALAYRQPILIGRNPELLQLNKWLAEASGGASQIVLVGGEPGIGKSSLINAFLLQAAAENELWIGRGQCVDHQGSSEPYLPMLDMLGWLCNSSDGARAVEVLRRHAPTWLAQMPGVISETEFEALQLRVRGVGQERMLREMAEAVEKMGARRAMVLVLEDLHWSDPSTLAWLDFFARRGRTARVMLIGTFRPVASLAALHPLRVIAGELLGRYCHELALRPLNSAEVADYVAHRIAVDADHRAGLSEIGRAIQKRTEGNPLFVVNVVDTLLSSLSSDSSPAQSVVELRTMVAASDQIVPDTIEETIIQHFTQLNACEQPLVEVASIAGTEFSAAAVAAGAQIPLGEVEEVCSALANRLSFLQAAGDGEWPDATVAARFRFRHSLYREVIYGRVTASRRAQSHRRIGERLQAACGESASDMAAELAWHFEQGRDNDRALHYREVAAQRAWQRAALQEAYEHLTAALRIAARLPQGPLRTQHELQLNVALAAALQNSQGWGVPEVERTYAVVEKLCEGLDDPHQLFLARMGLWGFAVGRGNWQRAHSLAELNLQLADSVGESGMLARSRRGAGHGLFFLGRFDQARTYLEQAVALDANAQHQPRTVLYVRRVAVDAAIVLSWAREITGYSDQAVAAMRLALSLAEEESHVPDLTSATCFAALFHWIRADWPALEIWARRCVALSSENAVPFIHALGTHLQGVAIAEQGQPEQGLTLIRKGIAACQALGTLSATSATHLGLARACQMAGKIPEAFEALNHAFEFIKTNAEHAWEAEVHRARGELILDRRNSPRRSSKVKREQEAESCFLTAIDVARNQGARKWELRATTSLCALWRDQAVKRKEARDRLAKACEGISEGAGCADVQAARLLISELSTSI